MPQALGGHPVLQAEDRLPEQADGVVEVGHRGLHPLAQFGLGGHGQRALQLQPRREDPLHDAALQVGGEPVAVLDHHELADLLLQPRGRLLRPADRPAGRASPRPAGRRARPTAARAVR